MFRPRLSFQTRSADRNQQTDLGRRKAIEGTLARQRADAESEMSGLQRRMEDAYQRATALLDNSEDYMARSPRDEHEIRQFELAAEAARQRISDLNGQLELFAALERLLRKGE